MTNSLPTFIFASTALATSLLAQESAAPARPAVATAAVSGVAAASRNDRIHASSEGASLLRDGKASALRKGITLTDGTTVAPNGDVFRADGTAVKLAAGEWLDLHGKVCSDSQPAATAPVTSSTGVVSSKGTDSINQAGVDLGTLEAERRTNVAIDEAVAAAPNNSAK